jgi:hypothetical protein
MLQGRVAVLAMTAAPRSPAGASPGAQIEGGGSATGAAPGHVRGRPRHRLGLRGRWPGVRRLAGRLGPRRRRSRARGGRVGLRGLERHSRHFYPDTIVCILRRLPARWTAARPAGRDRRPPAPPRARSEPARPRGSSTGTDRPPPGLRESPLSVSSAPQTSQRRWRLSGRLSSSRVTQHETRPRGAG